MKKLFYLFATALLSVGCNSGAELGGGDNPLPGNNNGTDGVAIGGVTWATRNVDTKGKFAANPEDFGGYFNFDAAQTACPKGWRTPTVNELQSLVNAGNMWTRVNGTDGRRFGSGNNTIFLPAAGSQWPGGDHYNAHYGYYCSSTPNPDPDLQGYYLYVSEGDTDILVSPSTGLKSVRCVRRENGGNNDNIWPSAQPDPRMAKGMYVGIVGFNESLQVMNPQLLNSSSRSRFTSFINGLTMRQGTGLYYAVDNSVDKLQTTVLPVDLVGASLVTFTDGLDNISIELNPNFDARDEYRDFIHDRIDGAIFRSLPVSAYSIGVKGDDVGDENAFRAGLDAMASGRTYVKMVTNTEELNAEFEELAGSLYSSSTSFVVDIRIPGGYDDGTKIRFTFDNVASATASTMYVEGTYRRDGGSRTLQNIVYNGLRSGSGTTVNGVVNGAFVTFSFDDLYTASGGSIQKGHEQQWYSTTASSVWQRNSEFGSGSDVVIVEERKSAVVMLVLDCTTSLGTAGFNAMKNAANNFIKVLSGMSSGSGANENGITIEGLTWATRNVGEYGKFVITPEDYGNHYSFEEAQTVCPSGWRTPAPKEFETLAKSGSVWTTSNGVNGTRFGSGSNTIFLPATGYRSHINGVITGPGSLGYYWSSTLRGENYGHYMYLTSKDVLPLSSTDYRLGFAVRCVRQ